MKGSKSKLLEAARRVRADIYKAVEAELLDDSGVVPRTYQSIADANGISAATVQRIAGSLGISRPVGPRPMGRYERLELAHDSVQQGGKGEEVTSHSHSEPEAKGNTNGG